MKIFMLESSGDVRWQALLAAALAAGALLLVGCGDLLDDLTGKDDDPGLPPPASAPALFDYGVASDISYWDSDPAAPGLEPSRKETFIYDASKRLEMQQNYDFDTVSVAWILKWEGEYTFDSAGKLATISGEDYDNAGNLVGGWRSSAIAYDSAGQLSDMDGTGISDVRGHPRAALPTGAAVSCQPQGVFFNRRLVLRGSGHQCRRLRGRRGIWEGGRGRFQRPRRTRLNPHCLQPVRGAYLHGAGVRGWLAARPMVDGSAARWPDRLLRRGDVRLPLAHDR